MSEPAPSKVRYIVAIEEPKGSRRWAVLDFLWAVSQSDATLQAYERNPGHGPFRVAPYVEDKPVPTPPDIVELFQSSSSTGIARQPQKGA